MVYAAAEDDPGEEEPERTVPVRSGTVEVELPKASWWKVEAEIPGHWLAPTVIESDRGEADLRLLPAGEVRIRLTEPRGEAPVDELTVRFTPAARGVEIVPGQEPPVPREALPGEARCRRETSPDWSCELPAGEVDLRFHATGFASEFRWGVSIAAGEAADLGSLTLVPGAAVLGWVALPSAGELSLESVELELAAETFDSLNPQVKRLVRTTPLQRSGLFQFRDLPPGTYRLTARAKGWAAAERTSIDVQRGRETELIWPLELRRPATVEICLDPPVPPGIRRQGDTWKATLHPETTELRQPLVGAVDGDGCWRREGVQPGWYRLAIADGRRSHWLERLISFPPGDFRLDLEMPLIAVEGTISRGGQPIRSRLTFERLRPAEGEQPAETRRIVLYSDFDGAYAGGLSEEGRWWVRVSFDGSRTEQFLQAVDVEKSERGPTRIDLEVPDTELAGRVVNEDGEGIARAAVSAYRLPIDPLSGSAPRSRTASDAEGRFEFEGLAAGHYRVSAFTAGSSATAEVGVEELIETPEVELVIADGHELTGRVVSARGPVIGARILAHPDLEAPRVIAVQSVVSDVEGEFVLSLPPDAISLRLLVLPPGHAARLLRVAADHHGALVVAVDDVGGTLVVSGGAAESLLGRSRLIAGDVEFDLTLLRDWSLLGTGEPPGQDGSWTLPMMSPGDYALCPPSGGPCERGFLAPFDTLVLTLPPTEAGVDSRSLDALRR